MLTLTNVWVTSFSRRLYVSVDCWNPCAWKLQKSIPRIWYWTHPIAGFQILGSPLLDHGFWGCFLDVCQFRKPLPEYSNPKKIKKENPINPQILPCTLNLFCIFFGGHHSIFCVYIYILYIYILYIYYIYTLYIYYIYTIYILYIYYIYTIYIYYTYFAGAVQATNPFTTINIFSRQVRVCRKGDGGVASAMHPKNSRRLYQNSSKLNMNMFSRYPSLNLSKV